MSKAEQREQNEEVPDWLVWWEKELLEKEHASLVMVNLTTGLESISDPPHCYDCGRLTKKSFVPRSVVSFDERLIIATPNLPGYRCEGCAVQEPHGRETLSYLSNEGISEFETAAAKIFRSRGYRTEADLFDR